MQNINERTAHWNRFDLVVGGIIAALAIGIALTLLVGDQAGVAIVDMLPQNHAHATSIIQITFAEPMNTASVETRFVTDPPIVGKFSWEGSTLSFKPSTRLTVGQRYTAAIHAGATSKQGRRTQKDITWTFDIAAPRIVYLFPAVDDGKSTVPNLWIADSTAPFKSKQITDEPFGVLSDYAVSPDGTRIAYASKDEQGHIDLYILTIDTGEIQRITQCGGAACQLPSWNPDSTRIAYERIEPGRISSDVNSQPHTWIVNLADLSTAPLFADAHLLGHAPRWSPDGNKIAVIDDNLASIAIYDLSNGNRELLPTLDDQPGVFDLTGTRFVYREVQKTNADFIVRVTVADLANPQSGLKPILAKDGSGPISFEDRQADWNPDGKQLVVARKYLDSRFTQGAQVYLVDADTGDAQPLIVDDQYNHAAISWDPTGDQLVMQCSSYGGNSSQSGIWVFNVRTKELKQVASNAYLPQWLP